MIFAAVIVVASASIIWAAWTGWGELHSLRRRFTAAQIESFRIADYLQNTVMHLNGSLLQIETGGGDAAALVQFNDACNALDRWIDEQKPLLSTAAERELMGKFDVEYDNYRSAARGLIGDAPPELRAVAPRLQHIDAAARRLMQLSTDLSHAHRAALDELISETQRSVERLEIVVGGALVLLVILSGWSVWLTWSELIAPLQVQLLASREQAERNEKLAALGVLAAGVAHEIRNPLTAIKARLFTQQRALPRESTAARDAEFIGTEISRLERIVRDFLLFARPGDPQRRTITARGLLSQVVELLRPELAESEIALSAEEGVPIEFAADEEQLKQVLINLVRNAAEAIGRNGWVVLRTRRETRAGSGEVVLLQVCDSGPGIAPEVCERLFDPFFSTKPSGTGLGLSIAARIAEKHGGTMQYRSQPGEGTTFDLVLPLTREKP